MPSASLLVLLLVVCSVHQIRGSLVGNGDAPWFCHDLDCPKFKVLETKDKYEVREYEKGTWVSTKVESYAYALAVPIGFRRLFKYIDGGNEDEVKIPMTSPVLVDVEPSCGPFCKNNFTVSFFVPFNFQESPPSPMDDSITIENTDSFVAFVSQSGGFRVDDFTLSRMASALTEALDEDGREYDASHFFFAGYDPPFRLKDRHNEVWVLSQEHQRKVDYA